MSIKVAEFGTVILTDESRIPADAKYLGCDETLKYYEANGTIYATM